MKNINKEKKLSGIATFLALLIIYPLISIADNNIDFNKGISPVIYVFAVWLLTILLVATLVNSKNKAKP